MEYVINGLQLSCPDEIHKFTDVLEGSDLGTGESQAELLLDIHHQGNVHQRVPSFDIGGRCRAVNDEIVVVEDIMEHIIDLGQSLIHGQALPL